MDILKARKIAREKKAAPPGEGPDKSRAQAAKGGAKRGKKARKKSPKKAKSRAETAGQRPSKKKDDKTARDVSSQPADHTPLDEIPPGAHAPEEIELTAEEFSALPGTQDMPELPELSEEEEELSGAVFLGDVIETKPDKPEDDPAAKPAITGKKEAKPVIEDEFIEEEEPPPSLYSDEAEFAADGFGEEEERTADEMPLEFLSFMIGLEEYCFPLNRISEIIKPRVITEAPRTPEFVLGILTLRGLVIPIFDLAKKLGLGKVDVAKASRIIIVNRDEDKLGLMVDRVKEVVKILPADIEPPPPVIAGVDMQFLDGVGRYEYWEGFRRATTNDETGDENSGKTLKRQLVILLNLARVATL